MSELVSVYVPTRNRSNLLTRCIESILKQSYANLELLLVDDASSDLTHQVLQKYAAKDSRVRLFRQEKPVGAPAARNIAIRNARGKYLTGLDDDDVMLPSRLESMLNAFDPRFSLICTGFIRKTPVRTIALANSRKIITLDEQLMRNHVGNAALSLTERFVEAGMFDEKMPAWQDYDLWTRMILKFGSALRISDASHVIHEDHDFPRISEMTLSGAEKFLAKHSNLMNRTQLRSQALETFFLENRRMTLGDFTRLASLRTSVRAARYFITSNIPIIRKLRR